MDADMQAVLASQEAKQKREMNAMMKQMGMEIDENDFDEDDEMKAIMQ